MSTDSSVSVKEKPQKDRLADGVFAGQYPQTVATPEAAAAMDDTPDERGYYRCRIDGKWYAKVYVRGTGIFSDGTPMVLGEKKYFQVQPIRWYSFSIGEGKGVLVSQNVLFTRAFDDRSNDWGDSYLREELLNFLLGCLDARTKARVVELPLDNDSVGLEVTEAGRSFTLTPENAPWSVQAVTWDAVFLFSRTEWQGIQTLSRPFLPTDYAKAMGAEISADGLGTGWLRTADSTERRAAVFGFDRGETALTPFDTGKDITCELGVVPVISVKMP